MAGWARRLHPHDARRLNHAALPATIAANLAPATFRSSAAFALFALLMTLELDRLGAAGGRFVQCERNVAADVASLPRSIPPTAEQVAENIAERRENVLDVGEVVRAETLAVE